MIKKIFIGLAVLVIGFVVGVSMQPAEYAYAASKVVKGPPEVAYGVVSGFAKWSEWSPWEGLDPKMNKKVEGPANGKGAKYSWDGNDEVGAGSMTITGAETNKRVDIDLVFTRPFEAQSKTSYVLEPAKDGTKVTWNISGTNNFMAKAFDLMVGMEAQMMKDFNKGLDKLDKVTGAEVARLEAEAKAKAEAEAKAKAEAEAAAAAEGGAEGEAKAN